MTTQPVQPPGEPSQDPAPTPPSPPPVQRSAGWYFEGFENREIRKAKDRADRAARRAERAARRVHEAQERAAGRSGGRQLVDAAGDAATAALTAVSAAADEAQARLAAKARMRELEHAVVTARAGGPVDVAPPTRHEALKLADRVEPGSPQASSVRGIGLILAGIVAFTMIQVGGFGWVGAIVPLVILGLSSSLADRIRAEDRSRKASQIQLELARAGLGSSARTPAAAIAQGPRNAQSVPAVGTMPATTGSGAVRPRLLETGDPRTRAEVLAVLDRLVANVSGWVPDTDVATLRRIRDSAERALPASDEPLDLTDHDTWLLRQICIDYVPRALDHFIALPPERASEPLLDGRSARQVLDEQLALIESRIEDMAKRSYQREAGGLLSHARFVADSLRPDPFQARLAELATNQAEPVAAAPDTAAAAQEPFAAVQEPLAAVQEPAPAAEASVPTGTAVVREREHA